MNDLTLLLTVFMGGGALGTMGGWARDWSERRRKDRTEREKGPQPICGCEHHFAYHDPETGKCHSMKKVPIEWDDDGDVMKAQLLECECRQYVGPEPLTVFYAPELTDGPATALNKREGD